MCKPQSIIPGTLIIVEDTNQLVLPTNWDSFLVNCDANGIMDNDIFIPSTVINTSVWVPTASKFYVYLMDTFLYPVLTTFGFPHLWTIEATFFHFEREKIFSLPSLLRAHATQNTTQSARFDLAVKRYSMGILTT